MNPKIESPAELHADHRRWQSDISMWKFDIEQWRSELSTALNELEKITEMVHLHEKTLREHAQGVDSIEAGLEFHEKNLAAGLLDRADSELDDALLEEHTKQTNRFSEQRDAHERIKKHHHIAMAHVATLKHALEAVTKS